MEDKSPEVIAQLYPQIALLLSAVPGLMALGPNAEQLVAMGKAMFQGAARIPAASPVQTHYLQLLQELAEILGQSRRR